MNDTLKVAGRIGDPADTYTAVDMATAAAQGFRDGQAAAEQAPAQGERETPVVVATTILGGLFHGGSGPELGEIDIDVCMPALEAIQYETVNSSDDVFLPLMTVAQHERIAASLTRPAQTEQQPAYVECRECTDCGHVGINDAHPTDATCAMCDWSGPSPVEDQCPDCGKENAMGAACPKCSGRYRILAETHVAAPIAQTAQGDDQ